MFVLIFMGFFTFMTEKDGKSCFSVKIHNNYSFTLIAKQVFEFLIYYTILCFIKYFHNDITTSHMVYKCTLQLYKPTYFFKVILP